MVVKYHKQIADGVISHLTSQQILRILEAVFKKAIKRVIRMLIYHMQAVPNPGAHVGASIAAKLTVNTRVKLITNTNIIRVPPVSIKNILEGVNYIALALALTTFATSLATILAKQCAKFTRFQRHIHPVCQFTIAFQCNNCISK